MVWLIIFLLTPREFIQIAKSKVAQVSSYSCVVYERIILGKEKQERTYKYYCKKPGWVRIDIIDGDDKGATAVYNPEINKVIACKRGALSFVKLKLPPQNKRVCSIRGGSIPEGTLYALLERWSYYIDNYNVNLQEEDKEIVLVSRIEEPEKFHLIDKEIMRLNKKDLFPVEIKRYHGDTLVEYLKIQDVIVNPEIDVSFFKL